MIGFPARPGSQPPIDRSFTINRNSPQAAGLVGWWPALASSGINVAKELVNGNNGSLSASSVISVSNEETGKAFNFSGAEYISIPSVPILNFSGQITVSVWININAFPSVGNVATIIQHGYDGTSEGFFSRLVNSSGTLTLQIGSYSNGGEYIASWGISDWNTGEWHHIYGGYDGWNWIICFDGALKASTHQTSGVFQTARPWGIGASDINGTWDRFLNGKISSILIKLTSPIIEEAGLYYAPQTRWDLYEDLSIFKFFYMPVQSHSPVHLPKTFSQPIDRPFTVNRNSPQAAGLVGWWPALGSRGGNKFRELNKGIESSTPLNLDHVSWVADPKAGMVLRLDSDTSTTNRAVLGDIDISGDMTVAVWATLRRKEYGKDVSLIAKWNTGAQVGTNEWEIGLNWFTSGDNYYPGFSVEIGSTPYTVLHTDQWQIDEETFLCGVRHGTTIYLYRSLAGLLVSNSNACGSGSINNITDRLIKLGQIDYSESYNTQADYSEIRLYDRALSEAEVRLLYDPSTRWDLYSPIAPPQIWSIPGVTGAIEESVTLAKFDGVSTSSQTTEQDVVPLDIHTGISASSQTTEQDAIVLDAYVGLTVAEEIPGSATEESIVLAIYLSVTQHQPEIIDESVTLGLIIATSSSAQSELQDTVSLGRTVGESYASNTDEKDAVILALGKVIGVVTQTNENDVVSLGRLNTIVPISQTVENDVVSLGRLNTIVPVSQTTENDAVILADFIGITVLEETQGFINETVILARSATVEVLQEGISHVNEDVTISRLSGISETTQCQINDSTTLNRLSGINEVLERYVNDGAILSRLVGISETEQCQVNDSAILNRSIGISETLERYVNDGAILNRLVGISELEQCQVNDVAILNRLSGISEFTQLQIDDSTILNRLNGVSEATQCQVNDIALLAKFLRITITDETIGQYSESVILDRFVGLTVLQEGISHVNENVSISRLNTITISEQSKLYNSLIFGRLNGLTIAPEFQLFNNLVFGRSNGLSINTQNIVNENITANKFNGLITNSQIIVPELISLSKLYGLAILDSRYLLENVNLQYSNGLSLIDSPTIFEEIELGRIDIMTVITVLFGYNNVNLDQYKSIIAEPPSLYVYNDGNHSVAVLFRDKRAGVPFRDKRTSVPWRDKRSGK